MDTKDAPRKQILDAAVAWSLNSHFAEKDYVLGWLLWGISGSERLAANLLFKGGTCIKKCFYETYRLSEDLDFTLTDPSCLDEGSLKDAFTEIGERIPKRAGIALPPDYQKFDIYKNPQGRTYCQGSIGYAGPIARRGEHMPRMKMDLTVSERVVLAPVQSPICHAYSGFPEGDVTVRTYAFEEILAEKIRALAERENPRDLYDITNLLRNPEVSPDLSVLRRTVEEKCAFKGIGLPTLAGMEARKGAFGEAWAPMLRRQLPVVPEMEPFWSYLPVFFEWLERGTGRPDLPVCPLREGEEALPGRVWRLPMSGRKRSHLGLVRFAASNHLCVDVRLRDGAARLEPYSLRQIKAGPIVLYARDVEADTLVSYRADHIQEAQVTSQPFVPRYRVDISSTFGL